MPVQAERQPECTMSVCSQGKSTMEPMPTPEKAMLIARPLRRTNQFGRCSAWPVKPSATLPAPTSTPSVR